MFTAKILNWFIHNATTHKEIEVYGDGEQKRDFIHVDDLVRLLKLSITCRNLWGKIFNVGFGQGISIHETAKLVAKYVPGTKIKFKPWPEIDKKIETGDYISDIQLLKKEVGWEPAIGFEEGIKSTIKFYEGRSK